MVNASFVVGWVLIVVAIICLIIELILTRDKTWRANWWKPKEKDFYYNLALLIIGIVSLVIGLILVIKHHKSY